MQVITAVIIVHMTITAWILILLTETGLSVIKIPGFCQDGADSSTLGLQVDLDCKMFTGYKAVYRICFAMSVWFLTFSILMINVKNSREPRAAVHNG